VIQLLELVILIGAPVALLYGMRRLIQRQSRLDDQRLSAAAQHHRDEE
jgi:hypothetical protein